MLQVLTRLPIKSCSVATILDRDFHWQLWLGRGLPLDGGGVGTAGWEGRGYQQLVAQPGREGMLAVVSLGPSLDPGITPRKHGGIPPFPSFAGRRPAKSPN